jgi:phage terminase large subunit-like protein
MWKLAVPDWAERLRAGRSLIPDDLPLDQAEADAGVKSFDLLRLPDVPGTPRLRDAVGPWFRQFVGVICGSRGENGAAAPISEAFVLVPKKNSKTTNGAGLMLTATIRSKRPRAEFVLVAPTQEVSELAFSQVCGMIALEPYLQNTIHVQDNIKRITYRKTGASLKVKSFDPKIVTGVKPSGILLDETHVVADAHDADRVIGQLRGGLISQPVGFLIQITTQSERPPSGVFKSELTKARAVRDGKLEAPILPLLYEFPPGADWRDPANWPMVLPNLGRSIDLERLRRDFAQADAAGLPELRRWASQHLNVEIGLDLTGDGWVGAKYWENQARRGLTFDEVLEASDCVVLGIDGGGLNDLLGVALLGRHAESGEWLHWGHAWAHPIALERHKQNAPRYRDFERDGDLTIVEETQQDLRDVADLAVRAYDAGKLLAIAVDPYGIASIVRTIQLAGIPEKLVVGIPQGWRLVGAIKSLERMLAARRFWHAGTALMSWVVSNARVELRGNAIAIEKSSTGSGKIDPLAALLDAAEVLAKAPESAAPQYQAFFVG